MAIKLDNDLLSKLNKEDVKKIQKLIESEIKQPEKYTVRLYKRFNFSEFYMKTKKSFNTIKEAKDYAKYISFEKFRTYDKVDIVDNKGEIIFESLV